MKVNGKEYKYSKVVDYSFNDEEDGVFFNKVEIIGDDLFLYTQTLFYPGILSDVLINEAPKGYDVIGDCLIVLKNYKIVSEFIEHRLEKNKLFGFFNWKKKKEMQLNNDKISYPLFNYYFCDKGKIVPSIDSMEYDATKKEISFINSSIKIIDNKKGVGTDYLVLGCDEITFYWNDCYSYKTGKKVD